MNDNFLCMSSTYKCTSITSHGRRRCRIMALTWSRYSPPNNTGISQLSIESITTTPLPLIWRSQSMSTGYFSVFLSEKLCVCVCVCAQVGLWWIYWTHRWISDLCLFISAERPMLTFYLCRKAKQWVACLRRRHKCHHNQTGPSVSSWTQVFPLIFLPVGLTCRLLCNFLRKDKLS